ncbi:MAG: ATP-binding protein [Dehalococcoidia bacterium]
MGEGAPANVAGRSLDADAARAALVEVGATRDLDAILARSAEILLQRFGADMALVYAARPGRKLWGAPTAGPLSVASLFSDSDTFTDASFVERLKARGFAVQSDLATVQNPSPGQEAICSAGIRSTMWTVLEGSIPGSPLGFLFVGSQNLHAFGEGDIHELQTLAAAIAWFVRPAVLLEERHLERGLLEEETRLLAAMAEAETESQLLETFTEGIRRALSADGAIVVIQPPSGGLPDFVGAPSAEFTSERWKGARDAILSSDHRSLVERARTSGAFAVPDLAIRAESPLEGWLRDSLGARSMAAAIRSQAWGGLGLGVAALRERPGSWSTVQTSFLARLARVLEISVERLRRGLIAIEHLLELERQTDLLALGAELVESLSSAEDISSACNLISSRLREFFSADHVAFGLIDLESGARNVLGFSSKVMERPEFSLKLSESDTAVYKDLTARGAGDCLPDLVDAEALNTAAARMLSLGIRSLMRTPFRLSDGRHGIVTLGSCKPNKYGPADSDRLLELCRSVAVAIDRVGLLARATATSTLLDAKTRVLSAAASPGMEKAGSAFAQECQKLFEASVAAAGVFENGDMTVIGAAGTSTSDPLLTAWLSMETQELAPGSANGLMRASLVDSTGTARGAVVASAPDHRRWSEEEVARFKELAAGLALVVERAQLTQAAADKSAKVHALTQLLSALSLSSAPEDVASLIAAQVREYLGADAVLVYAFDRDTGQRVRIAFDAIKGRVDAPERVPLDSSSSYRGVRENPHTHYTALEPATGPDWLRESAERMGFKSAVCVRLDAAGETVGMVAAGSTDAASMTLRELDSLVAVAAPVAMVLERARAVTALREETNRTQAVLDILAALGPAESIDLVAAPVAEALKNMFAADHCSISSIDGEFATLVALQSDVVPWTRGHRIPVERFWEESTASAHALRVFSDLSVADGLSPVLRQANESGLRSAMQVLIGSPSDPLGTVIVGSRQPGKFNEFDARQLAKIVQPLAVAAQYFRNKRETALRTRRLETTNRVLLRLSAGGTPEHLARGFLAECRSLFDSPHALSVQFDQETRTARVLAMDTDYPMGEAFPLEYALEEAHTARMLRQPTPEIVHDSRNEAALNAHHRQLMSAGAYSAIRAPIVVHDTVRGAVSLWGEGAGRFTSDDAELLGALTRPLALALEKASALESLGESELKYRSLVAQADEMIFLFDPGTFRVLDANAFTWAALGYSPEQAADFTFDRIFDGGPDELRETVAAAIADGELRLSAARFIRRDETRLDVDAVASMVTFGGKQAVLVLARDVSERNALLRQLMQSQKMDSLGAMAGAVAHDFNNLLTTILGFAGLLKRSPNFDTEERENLALIEDAARRAADLTGRLLSFSRGGLARFGKVDLRTVAEDTLQLAEPTMHSKLSVRRSIPEAPVLVEGDAGQLQQALTNIVLNARDAMPEGGTIEVALRVEGTVALIEIRDDGPGMDEETRMRIFEPFYTTKAPGSGTGLGMAITYGIVQGHHGDITVESTPGQGTLFSISLPLLAANADTAAEDAFSAGEGNLVLVVDDDAMVRRTTTATLAELGYNVVEAPGGSTAVAILQARPDRFSAVLLDLVMPGMTGSETFRALTAIRPDLPVVVCTGYAADAHIDTDVKRRIAGLVQKPFSAERLGRALLAAGAAPTRPSRI